MQLKSEPCNKRITPVQCQIDTGAEMNVISKEDYESVVSDHKQRKLSPPQCRIMAYGGHQINNLGSCQLNVQHKGQEKAVQFKVTEVDGPTILGCKTCSDLEFVTFTCNLTQKVDVQTNTPLTREKLLSDYLDCFEGLEKINMKPYHITLEPNAEPAIYPPRSVPVHLRELYKQELDKMLELGTVAQVETPTAWVTSIVLSESTNEKG